MLISILCSYPHASLNIAGPVYQRYMGFPSKESACNAGELGDGDSISGLVRSCGGRGNPRQYSRLENPMARGAWQAMV